MTTTYKLVLEYDGSAFHGWQAQPSVRTVAGELATALATVTGGHPRVTAAGRTDAGAHSRGQTVSFELEGEVTPAALRDSLNGVLPRDVAVLQAETVEPGFSARFSARRRTYRYLVENRVARPALLRSGAWHVRQPLDTAAMRAAATALIGRNDLSAFGSDPAGRNTVRNLESLRIRRVRQATGGAMVSFELAADAFLYGMVRRIVGFLVEVGLGKRQPAEARLLTSGATSSTARVAPAHGLYQMKVEY